MRQQARFFDLTPPAAIGAPVMALGIFAAAALQRLPGGAAATGFVAVGAVVIWLAIAVALVRSISRRGASFYTAPVLAGFGLGTWVAASAVVARMVMLAAPAFGWAARGFFLASAALWLWFLPLALRNFARLAVSAPGQPSGVILLATVATQAVALMALRLFADMGAVHWIATALIAFGILCYAIGLALILRRYSGERWRLADDWDNSNCILHGALSITGLAAVISGNFAAAALLAFWLTVVAVFIVVESIELLRLRLRVKALGWRAGLFVYDISQWARNFTFGMFYAFTLAFAERVPKLPAHSLVESLRSAILAGGQYVVLLLLLAETAVMLWSARRRSAKPAAMRATWHALQRSYGLARSAVIYHGNPVKRRRARAFYRAFVRPGELCFDIGAHLGDRTGHFLALGARVVSVEPQPGPLAVLRRLYGGDPHVTLVAEAVGAMPGEAELAIDPANPTIASLSPEWRAQVARDPSFAGTDWRERHRVAVTTLDALIAAHGVPQFCKIDVEGFEGAVLEGLSRPLPALSFEYVAAAREPALAALDRLAALGRYRFNRSPGESMCFPIADWRSHADMAAELRALPTNSGSGDIYARLAP